MIFKMLFRPVFRLIPAFAIISVFGVLIGRFVFSIPHGELGVVVSVPLVVAFMFTRLLLVVTPRKNGEITIHSPLRIISALAVFLGVSAIVVMLPSALIYYWIGLKSISHG